MTSYSDFDDLRSDIFPPESQPGTALTFFLKKLATCRLRPDTDLLDRHLESESYETCRRCTTVGQLDAVAGLILAAAQRKWPTANEDRLTISITKGRNRGNAVRRNREALAMIAQGIAILAELAGGDA